MDVARIRMRMRHGKVSSPTRRGYVGFRFVSLHCHYVALRSHVRPLAHTIHHTPNTTHHTPHTQAINESSQQKHAAELDSYRNDAREAADKVEVELQVSPNLSLSLRFKCLFIHIYTLLYHLHSK